MGGVIAKESSLLVANEKMFRGKFAIDVRTNCEAISVIAEEEDRRAAQRHDRRGDHRALRQAGAVARRAFGPPPLPGIDLPGIFQVRTVPDVRAIREWIEQGTAFLAGMYNYAGIQFVKPTRRAVVVGGGFIGLETAENLVHLGFEVTVVQKLDQVLGPVDREIARLIEEYVKGTACAWRSTTAWPDSSSWTAARWRYRRSPARPIRPTS